MTKRKRVGVSVALAMLAASLCLGAGLFVANAANAEDSFELFTVSGRNSKTEKDSTYLAAAHQDPTVVDGKGNPVVGAGSVTGVRVSLAQGDTFHYTKVIDLSGKTKTDKLIELAITPERIGVTETEMIEVILTDAYDPDNVITFNVIRAFDKKSDSEAKGPGLNNGVSYFRAGFGGQLAAVDHFWNTSRYGENRDQGAIMFLDFSAAGGGSQNYDAVDSVEKNVLQIYYDDASKEVYMDDKQVFWSKGRPVCDFDDEELFTSAWEDFTTGECFLSIRGRNYEANSFNFVLTEVDGQKVSEISPERDLHTIAVDTLGFAENELPHAVVGKTYPVFGASSVSPYYGRLTVNTAVYFGGEDGERLAVENRRFACERAGDYTIVYTADDGHGKTAKKTLTVTATDDPVELSIELSGHETEGFVAGDLLVFPQATVRGYIGTVEVKKYISLNGEKTEVEGDEYRFMRTGEYEVSFVAEDLVGNSNSVSYTINVAAGAAAQFTDPITVPKYFIMGRTYTLPTVYARNYTDGSGDQIKAKIYCTDDSGEKVLPTGKLTPTAGSSVKITYDAELNGTHAKKEFVIPVIALKDEQGGIHADKLFYATEGNPDLTVNETDVTITTYENVSVDYVNPVASNGFTFAFHGNARFSSFQTVTLILSDAEDSAISVKFTYANEAGNTVFYVGDDGRKYPLSERLYSDDNITLNYKQATRSVAFSSNTRINVNIAKMVSGEAFNGFPSGLVTATIVVGGVTNGAKIAVKQISNQRIGDLSFGEFAAPVVFSTHDLGGTKKLGAAVTLPGLRVADAVDPGLSLMVSVSDPNGNPVTANDGTLLQNANGDKDYEITLAKYGSYTVYYATKDLSGNSAGLSYLIEVLNDNAPEIVLSGEVPAQIKAGEAVALPSASATGGIEVNLYVMTEQGQLVTVKNGAFTFRNAGTYKIFYWCTDEAGNMTCNEYVVTAVA